MSLIRNIAGRTIAAWHARTFAFKAISFALVGVINAAVDYGMFFLALGTLNAWPSLVELALKLTEACGCLSVETWIIIPANGISWLVAVSGSYVMNSYTTFARESGRKLRWRDYRTFVVSGIAGVIANTTTVVVAVQFVPVEVAKLIAILVGFVVNFSMSHFVVFRPRAQQSAD
jgi:putative flippase GtrA